MASGSILASRRILASWTILAVGEITLSLAVKFCPRSGRVGRRLASGRSRARELTLALGGRRRASGLASGGRACASNEQIWLADSSIGRSCSRMQPGIERGLARLRIEQGGMARTTDNEITLSLRTGGLAVDNPAGTSKMSDEALVCIFAHLHKPADRRAISLVCQQWKRLDSENRKCVEIANYHSVTPAMLSERFPNLTRLKVKGTPRAHEYGSLSRSFDALALPWIEEVGRSYGNNLKSLWLKRMHVDDGDLKLLAKSCSESLLSLKLYRCYGFSTAGLAAISSSCRSLKELFLESSDVLAPAEIERSATSSWLENLALTALNLEELNFQYISGSVDIVMSHLKLLMENCKALRSLKLNYTDIWAVEGVFAKSTVLSELGTGSWKNVGGRHASTLDPSFPTSIIGLSGLYEFADISVPAISNVLRNIKKLNLLATSLTPDGHRRVLKNCGNLEDLMVNRNIGNDGLLALAATCRNLRRLQIAEHVEGALISPHGIIPLAQNCVRVEFLALCVTSLNNASLAAIGDNCKVLRDVCILFIHEEDAPQHKYFPLDDGVKKLLEGSRQVTRLALKLWPGTLTDAGMAHIGKYGAKLKWILLGFVGESNDGLLSLARGCKSLERLEILDCPKITERGLASAARQMKESLKFLWVQGFSAQDKGRLLANCRFHWIVEFHNSTECAQFGHDQLTAYCSLTGPRTNHCPEISVLSSDLASNSDKNGVNLRLSL